MLVPRRKFLKTGALSVLSTGIMLRTFRTGLAQKSTTPVQRSSEMPLESQLDPVFSFKAETFKPYVGGFFQAPNALGKLIALKLVSLNVFTPSKTALSVTKSAGLTESFSLLFKAEATLPPFTSIHKITHPALGEFFLFLQHRKGAKGELLYEAVINHIP